MTNEEQNTTPTESEQATALNKAFDESKLTFHSRADSLKSFKADRDIVYDNGQPFAVYDGVVQPLSDALAKWGSDNRGFIDGRSLPRVGVDSSRPSDLSKSSFSTVAEKVAFITEHGADAFAALPTQHVDTAELTTFEQWKALPIEEKVRLTQLDNNIIAKLTRTPPAKQNGVWSKPGVLDELKSKNPSFRPVGWSRNAMTKVS